MPGGIFHLIMWLMILVATLALVAASFVYMVNKIGRFGWIRQAAGSRKGRQRLISLALILIGYVALSLGMSFVNATAIYLHLVFFFLLSGLVILLAGRIFGSKPDRGDSISWDHDTGLMEEGSCSKWRNLYWQGWIALVATCLTMGIGYYLCNHVWETDYDLTTDKAGVNLTAAVFSDSHMGTTFDGDGFAAYMQEIAEKNPDILLIPGDFVDDWSNRKDMLRACQALGELDLKYGVWYAFGNHDSGFFSDRDFSQQDLRDALTANGVHILEDGYALVDESFYIVGRRDPSMGDRMDMDQLLDGLDPSKYIIVMDHQPNDYENEAASNADLVLSGHTHGGQMFPIQILGKLIGAFDRAYGYEKRNGTEFIVTSGISDWDLQFKTGTKSEYLILKIHN